MKANRNDLAQAVVFAAQGCGAIFPVYSSLLFRSGPDGLRFTGSDGLTVFRSTISGCYPEAEILLPGVFAKVVPVLAGEEVSFVLDELTVTITSGRSVFTFQCLPAEDYPVRVPNLPGRGHAWAEDLATALKSILPAVDTAGTGGVPALTGILARQVKDHLELLATDRYCLGWARCEFRPAGTESPGVIIPGHVAQKLAKLTGELMLDWDENTFQARSDGFLIASRAIQGTFPKWTYPKADAWVHVGPEFAPAVKRAAATGALAISLELGGDDLLITSSGSQGSFAERLQFAYNDPVRFSVGTRMLLDGLAGCGEMAEIGFTAPDKPVHFRSDNYLWSLQPRRET